MSHSSVQPVQVKGLLIDRQRPRHRLFSRVQPVELVLFGILLAFFVWLVFPPVASLVVKAFTDGDTNELTFDHFVTILPTLVHAGVISNTLIFAVSASVISFAYGSVLAWLAERTNAPFRRLVYVSAFLSFALPTVIQVLGWVFLLGRRQGFINSILVTQLGILSEPLDVQSMGGMIFVEAILWTAVVFLLMVVPFRSMDASLEEAGRVARGTSAEVFLRITLRLAMPAGFAVFFISLVRNLESFEVPAILGLPGGVNVLATQIFVRLHATVLPNYGQVSAYSILLVLIVLPLLYAYHRATKGQGHYATITGKGLRTARLDLGRYRWAAGIFMLTLPLVILLPLFMLVWVSLMPFYRIPSWEALGSASLNNYYALVDSGSRVLDSLAATALVAGGSATILVFATAAACWLVIRTRVPGRSALEFVSVIPLAIPSIVLGAGVLWAYVGLPVPIYGTAAILVLAYMARSLPFTMRSNFSGVLSISKELEESAFVAGANHRELFQRVLIPLLLPALLTGWQYAFLQTARELPIALLLQSEGNQMISVRIWNLWEVGQVTNAAALSVVVAILLGILGFVLEGLSRRYGIVAAEASGRR
ncbi:ABC transporter permease [Microvirga zambiensis]|uniref:ABC transporter permease n=1 Tax=Microvirga zambiensis TaxID=1402137 RepID=UPI00191F554D|nr:iron ABC transporter permease [Microvirga zambiensis]